MSYQNLINAIVRSELAGKTFKYVASNSRDSTTVNGTQFFTLTYRINERLQTLIPQLRGDDGVSIADVYNEGNSIIITYSDDTDTRFDEIYPENPVGILNYYVDVNGDLVQETSDGNNIVGNVLPEEARGITNAELLENGDIRFTFTDNSTTDVGNISEFGEPPILNTEIINNNLLVTFSNDNTKNVGMVQGDKGLSAPEFVNIEQVRTGETTVFFDFTMADGKTFRVGPAKVETRVAVPEDSLKLSYGADEVTSELILYPPSVPAINLGLMDGVDGIDANDGISIESARISDNGENIFIKLSGENESVIAGTPRQIVIPAGDTEILSYSITAARELVFELGIPNNPSVRVNVGRVKGSDGINIDDVQILSNGDIEVTVNNDGRVRSTVIGNVSYEAIESAEILPTRELVLKTTKNNTIIAEGSPDGSDGKLGTFIQSIDYDTENEMMASVVLTDETIINDIGKVRPYKTHSVTRNTNDEIIFNFSDGSTTNLGVIDGVDAKNISTVTYENDALTINFDDSSTIVATGSINNITGLSYTNDGLVFNYDTYTKSVELPPRYDGTHGKWLTELRELVNGRLRAIYNDGSFNTLDGGSVHGNWVTSISFDTDTNPSDVNVNVSFYNDTVDTPARNIGTISNFYGMDGEIITNMSYLPDGSINVEWNNKDDQVIESVRPVWLEDVYLDGDNFMAKYNHLSDPVVISTVDGFNGVDGRWITGWRVSNLSSDLLVTWNDGSEGNIGYIDGVGGNWIVDIFINDDDMLVTTDRYGVDEIRGDFSQLNGLLGKWVTNLEIDQDRNLLIEYNIGDSDSFIDVDGEHGVVLENITLNDPERTLEVQFSNRTETLENIDGSDGNVPVNFYRNDDGMYEVEFFDGTITNYIKIDGDDFSNEITNIYLQNDTIVVTITDGTQYQYATIIRKVEDGIVENDVLSFSTNYTTENIEVGNVAGIDVPDGIYITNLEVIDQELYADYSDETKSLIAPFNRNDFSTVELVDGAATELENLSITTTDGTVFDLGRVKGLGETVNIVDGIINIEGKLVLTFSDDRTTISAERIQGEHGLDIVSCEIDTDGFLIFNMSDSSTVNAGFVLQDLGFAPFDFVRTYNRGESCTNNGQIYVALDNGVTSEPTPENSQWARVRLQGDSNYPDASRPELISPINSQEHQFTQPYLLAGELRNYYSVDTRDTRIFQIDLAENNFIEPLYEANENVDGHQVNLNLDVGVEYKWRCRDVVAETNYITDWSLEGRFTVVANIVQRPTVTLGTGMDSSAMPAMPVFDSSVFNGAGSHTDSIWEIKRNSDDKIVYSDMSGNLASLMVPFGILVEDTDYSVRVQYKGSNGDSPFSEWVPFTTEVKFTINLTPEISFIGDDINATTAKPYFKSNSFLDEFYYDYMQGSDLTAHWEVRDSTNALVWETSNKIDILTVQVDEVLKSSETYTARVQYSSERFFGISEWSNTLSFTPDWFIQKPIVSTALDITEYPIDGYFESDAFVATNEEHFGSVWEVRKVSDDSVQHSSYNSFEDKLDWSVSFNERDSQQEYYIVLKHLGRYGESDWSEPLSFTMQEIINVSVYISSVDQTVRRLNNDGRAMWINEDHTARTNGVAVDDLRNAYSVSNDFVLRKVNEFGVEQWTYTHTTNILCVAVDTNYDVVIGTDDNLVIKFDSLGNELWQYDGHSNNVNSVVVDNEFYVYSASTDNTVQKINKDGRMEWTFTGHTASVNSVDVDINGNVYTASSDRTVRKISSNRFQIWSFTGHTGIVNSVSVNTNFNVFSGGVDSTLRRIDENGSEVWSYNAGFAVTSVDSDYLNRSYIGTTNDTVSMINDAGSEVWVYTDNTGDITDVAVNEIPLLFKPIELTGRFWLLVAPTNLTAF